MLTVKNVYDYLDYIAPFNTAAEWDNSGLTVGDMNAPVSKILIALDVTKAVIKEAESFGAELIVTHHPLIFDPVKSVENGSTLYAAVSSGKSFIASHTCLDKAIGGVNDCLARAVGLNNVYQSSLDEFLKVGEYESVSASDFAKLLKEKLGGAVQYNNTNKMIKKVAFCSGAGGDFVKLAKAEGADALLTGEAHHHEFLEAEENDISLFAAGHFETERVVLEYLKNALTSQFDGEIAIAVSSQASPIITL